MLAILLVLLQAEEVLLSRSSYLSNLPRNFLQFLFAALLLFLGDASSNSFILPLEFQLAYSGHTPTALVKPWIGCYVMICNHKEHHHNSQPGLQT